MTPDYFRVLAQYNRWMNTSLYGVAAAMTDEERKRDRGAFFKSIHATFDHLLLADRVWMGRFTHQPLEPGSIGPGGIRSLDQELYASFEELRAAREVADREIEAWIEAVTADQLAETLRYGKRSVPLWAAVAHLFNHQTHHRGQVTTLMTQAGHDVGATDLVAMLRGERPL